LDIDRKQKWGVEPKAVSTKTHLVTELLDLCLAEGLALHELGDPVVDIVVGRHDG
jgi:hypothetical protein